MRRDFALFITTHGRANNQITLSTFKELGYTGNWYLVVDDLDDQLDLYIDNFGAEHILVFDKHKFVQLTESCQSVPQYKAVVYARNATEEFARALGYKYFMVVDDDVTRLRLRYDLDGSLKSASLVGHIDEILDLILNYMDNSDVACLTFGFTNTYRGGVVSIENFTSRNRFCAELFIRKVSVPVSWRANFVEDLVTSIDAGIEGKVFLQFIPIQLELCMNEGVMPGGMSDAYNQTGRFKFYSLPTIIYPNCISVVFDGKWKTRTQAEYSVPKIISGRYKIAVTR